MSDTSSPPVPAAFAAASAAVREALSRDDLAVSEIPAPGGLAPHALALAGDVVGASGRADAELGTGRFVLLYDESAPEAWGGVFRVVCFAQAPLETDLALDPFVADVAWSWLVDSLDAGGASRHSASGTATKVLSSGYGELAAQGDGAQLELRASWTPTSTDLAPHVAAWSELICTLAGLPPTVEGVTLLASRRVGRD
ncbi:MULTISPECIES: DUF3000 domain-containing protein [unclassified Frigoribacterium]|uniref:DUF3000 domain-containing protein n=1 Tax=unclassified Frigoribacterium TaxID=2627005 RepID=UPI000F48C25B|nr:MULTISPECIES: DUF3000 domain-containing protein [unclassified Frigoribacterium]MBD8584511.1 DUF3000 domain-containing protein [Frigoribacterium sp. CFBP 8766]MBD8609270.1 DUF3000 domain-containing protein [Frigoribacterium sp. CFBP 13729]MBF4578354.1 DUF3000 domain-containing protein [Frigoribacterium sp. VKM Ac-2530]ROP77812.1 DUF3000 family protein [Frigoribacterium sp. PhB107]TDT65655.1 DUF3000 family protein [Frigoribacterium sp. PhB116]